IFPRPALQRDVRQRLYFATLLGQQVGQQLRIAYALFFPAQRARFTRLVVEDGEATTLQRVDAVDAHLESAAGDGDLAQGFQAFDAERGAPCFFLEQRLDE